MRIKIFFIQQTGDHANVREIKKIQAVSEKRLYAKRNVAGREEITDFNDGHLANGTPMHRKLQLFFIFVLAICLQAHAADWMPDAHLEQAIRETLEFPDGIPILPADMQQFEELYLQESGIADITGLEFATHLRILHIQRNPITDLSPLAGLIQLEELHFWHNQEDKTSGTSRGTHLDLSPLSGLINLKVLSLEGNGIEDISALVGLHQLEVLGLGGNQITDVAPLAHLTQLRVLGIEGNNITDLSPLKALTNIGPPDVCEIAPQGQPFQDRIENRNFPSIGLPGWRLVDLNTGGWLWESDSEAFHAAAGKYDIHYYGYNFGLFWNPPPTAPYYGLVTRLSGDMEYAILLSQQYHDRNPNFIATVSMAFHMHSELSVYPPDSDFWLKNEEGEILKNEGVPWDEFIIDILNPEVQQLLIDRVVGAAECGLFGGVFFDGWDKFHIHAYGVVLGDGTDAYVEVKAKEVREAYITLLKGIRARVRDDFLIIVNRNVDKSPHYAEWINGSYMETNLDTIQNFTLERFIEVENALLWNERHLREPRVNILQGGTLLDQPFNSTENQRWMRFFTTLSLTHSDGYVGFPGVTGIVNGSPELVNGWYDFWDADLGRPIGEKAQRYKNIDGLFIREFTNGWAVYNRSGFAQTVSLPYKTTGVSSGREGTQHVLADLDGEIYIKSISVDVNGDGVVNILDLVIVANSLGEKSPDFNGDGVVNILDLVIVANAFGD